MMRIIMVIISATIALSGCDGLPLPQQVVAVQPRGYHDVAYYDANPMERQEVAAWCNNNPYLAERTADCASAASANIHELHHRIRGD